jgi:transcriptional regulator with XRE-family HTH domain
MGDEAERSSGRPRPDAVDAQIGARLRERRTRLGMSQEQLADRIGVSFQQIQKYERGVNRIAAARLHELARALDVALGYFYTDRTSPLRGMAEDGQEPFGEAVGASPEAEDLLTAFARITDPMVRQRVLELVKSLAPPRPRNSREK